MFADMRHNLTDKIIDIFQTKLGWTTYWFDTTKDTNLNNLDGQLLINTENEVLHLVCEIKKTVLPSTLPSIDQKLNTLDLKALKANASILLANYISTNARELLQQRKINYADTGGNIFLECKGMYVHIETGQSDRSVLSNDTGRAFTKTGLKVIHQYFRTNKIMTFKDSYKRIAEEAKVSKDTVSKVILDLLATGYIIRKNKNEIKWRAKKDLFERWVQSYNQILRPSLQSQRFKFLDKNQKPNLIPPPGYQIAGYNAVDQWFSIPNDIQIINPVITYYTHKPLVNAIKDLQLIPDPNGKVIIYEAFWKEGSDERVDFPKDESNEHTAMDNIISYADLINENDPRYLEVANFLYLKSYHDKL